MACGIQLQGLETCIDSKGTQALLEAFGSSTASLQGAKIIRQLAVKGWALYMTSSSSTTASKPSSSGSSSSSKPQAGAADVITGSQGSTSQGAGPSRSSSHSSLRAPDAAAVPAEDYLVPPVDAALRIVVRDGPLPALPSSPRAAAAPTVELDVEIGAGEAVQQRQLHTWGFRQ
jgi:hypothetical protein